MCVASVALHKLLQLETALVLASRVCVLMIDDRDRWIKKSRPS